MKIEMPNWAKWACQQCRSTAVPWRTLGLALAVIGFLTWQWSHSHRALSDALRGAEEAQLKLRGQIVAEQDDKREMAASVDKLLAENELVKQAYEEALRAAPDAKPTGVATLKTLPIEVRGEARAVPPEPEKGVDPTAYLKVSECVLQNGDTASVKIDQVELTTKAGNTLIAGTAEVWRESPEPRGKFLSGKFQSYLSDVHGLAPPAPPRWGAELVGLCTGAGCGLGAGVLLPPARLPLLGWRLEARAGAMAGPALAAYGGLGVRW